MLTIEQVQERFPGWPDLRLEPNATDKFGSTALLFACRWRDGADYVAALLDIPGINLHVCDYGKNTPLMTACFFENVDTLKLLLAREDLDVNEAWWEHHYSPLIIACGRGCTPIVEQLLTRTDLDITSRDRYYRVTPLQRAISCGNVEVVSLLAEALKMGASDREGAIKQAIAEAQNPLNKLSFYNNMVPRLADPSLADRTSECSKPAI